MIELISSSTLDTIASLFLSNHRLGQNPRVDFTFLLKQEEEEEQQQQQQHQEQQEGSLQRNSQRWYNARSSCHYRGWQHGWTVQGLHESHTAILL